jgi:LysM repeat protein
MSTKHIFFLKTFLGVAFLFYGSLLFSQDLSAKQLLNKSIAAMDSIKRAKYILSKQERLINNKMFETELIVKVQPQPTKVYLYSLKPNPGAEALWVEGKNSGNVLINPNRFPFMNISLQPYSALLRDDQHHTILNVGFQYINTILKTHIAKDSSYFYSCVSYDGDINWNGRAYYKITIDNKKFDYVTYEVQKGETLTSIAKKLTINDYMILCNNPKINNYNDVKAGQKIIIPNSYARKIIFYIDKINFLPLCQFVYDDKGLYEKYEMNSFLLNPTIDPEEFTSKHKGYGF